MFVVDIFTFIAEVVGVTASGALAPGPLFVKNITEGSKFGARSGFVFAVGTELSSSVWS